MKTPKKKKVSQDTFLQKTQQERMTNLWDNREDEAWEKA